MRSLSRIRQMRRISQLATGFTVSLWPMAGDPDCSAKLIATVGVGSGRHVPNLHPTEFVLFDGEQLILDYSVIEHLAAPTLAIGLLIPATGDSVDPALSVKPDWLPNPNGLRPEDQWCVEQFTPDPAPARQLSRVHPAAIGSSILGLDALEPEIAAESIPVQGFSRAFKALVKAVVPIPSVRHLICVANTSTLPIRFDEIKDELHRARLAKVTIHAIVPSDGPHDEVLETLCRKTGGGFHRFSNPEEIPALLQHIQLSLLEHYEISFARISPEARNLLTVRICSPRGHGEARTADPGSPTAPHAGFTALQSSGEASDK